MMKKNLNIIIQYISKIFNLYILLFLLSNIKNQKIFNILNYNEITRNIEHQNPYEQYLDLSFFHEKTQYFILGPNNRDNLRYLWKFKLRFLNDEFLLSSTETSNNLNS